MSHIEEKRKIGDLLKEEILKKLIEPSYYTDVNETIRGRKCWRISGHVFESMSKILLALSGILSFAAGVYDDKILSFVAGTLSTVSLATFQFSLYSMKMHKKNSLELNQLLEKLDIETVPIFETTAIENIQFSEPTMMCKNDSNNDDKKSVQIVTELIQNKDLTDQQKDNSEYSNEKSESTSLIEMQSLNKKYNHSISSSVIPPTPDNSVV